MPPKNRNSRGRDPRRRGGQAILESALVLLVFLMVLFAIMDFSQVLFTHQMLVERTRSGLRWGMIHAGVRW